MISALYAALAALLIVWLSLSVIRLRRQNKISIGDGGNDDLRLAMAAQSNAVEYIPIALLLLFAIELNGAAVWLLHAFGVALLLGRVTHAQGFLAKNLKRRVLGMQITIFTIIGLAVANVVCLPYAKVLPH